MYYAKQIFNKITNDNVTYSQYLLIGLAIIQLSATFVSSQIADKLGRKTLILRGQSLMAIYLLLMVLFDKILIKVVDNDICSVFMIIIIFLHLITMNITLGLVVWFIVLK